VLNAAFSIGLQSLTLLVISGSYRSVNMRRCGRGFDWEEAVHYEVDLTSAAQQAKIASDRTAAVAALTAKVHNQLTARHPKGPTGRFCAMYGSVQCEQCHTDVQGPLLQCMHCKDCSLCVACQHIATGVLHEGHVFKVVQPPATVESSNSSLNFAAFRARAAARVAQETAATPVRTKRRWWACVIVSSWLFFILFLTLYYET
jgi:hypothetical protein